MLVSKAVVGSGPSIPVQISEEARSRVLMHIRTIPFISK